MPMKFGSAIAVALSLSASAYGAGLEKSVLWSGHYAGIGGAVVSSVRGSEALFFNPAGLASGNGTDVSLNFSPTFTQSRAQLVPLQPPVSSAYKFSPVMAGFASYSPTPKFGFGIGSYVSGGTRAIFENVDYTLYGESDLKPNIQSDLTIWEAAAGAGYEVFDGFRIGASIRVVTVQGLYSSATLIEAPNSNAGLTATDFYDLTGTKWGAFRVGAQYAPDDQSWGVGADFRSNADFTANGQVNARKQIYATPGVLQLGGGAASIGGSLPYQLSVGGHYDIEPKVSRIHAEYALTNYKRDAQFDVTGVVAGTALPSVALNWSNMSVIRVGYEYKPANVVYRAGYVYTSQVTPTALASPVFSSPAPGHTLVAGAGTHVNNNLEVDGALEFSFATGAGSSQEVDPRANLVGDFSTYALAVHTGVTYKF